jgi:hypothetical protein
LAVALVVVVKPLLCLAAGVVVVAVLAVLAIQALLVVVHHQVPLLAVVLQIITLVEVVVVVVLLLLETLNLAGVRVVVLSAQQVEMGVLQYTAVAAVVVAGVFLLMTQVVMEVLGAQPIVIHRVAAVLPDGPVQQGLNLQQDILVVAVAGEVHR